MRFRFEQLKSINVRNLIVPPDTINLPNVYFKIVIDHETVYLSEIAPCTINPAWFPIELDEENQKKYRYASNVQLVVQCADANVLKCRGRSTSIGTLGTQVPPLTYQRPVNEEIIRSISKISNAFTLDINFQYLEKLRLPLTSLPSIPKNTVIFEFPDGFYGNPMLMHHIRHSGVTLRRQRSPSPSEHEVDYDLMLGVRSIERIAALKNRKDALEEERTKQQTRIEEQIHCCSNQSQDQVQRLILNDENEALRQQLQMMQMVVAREKEAYEQEKKQIDKFPAIENALKQIIAVDETRDQIKDEIRKERRDVLRIAQLIRSRQAYLVHQLSLLYPIEYGGTGEYRICKIRLSKADLASKDDEHISTALGYTCHLVFMLSKYLQIPLRYRLVHFASRSYVQDVVQGNGAEYPLYRRGADKERFERAIAFLGKNVHQLLAARGIVIDDRLSILGRIKYLIDSETRWLKTHGISED